MIMSRATKKALYKINDFVEEKIINDNLENIFGERFGRYSKYIIQERALPDARDGLKPVQRRILYGMYRLGMFPNKPYKKSARIVGEVMGKYHPHGDSSIYEAMVRMSQNFKTLLPLIDMHGNNGSIDGDPAAAMRYTEARLSSNSEFLLKDLNKRTVGFVPNFDDEELEPVVLPARFPNLLVNGATGIAAGYATDIPPHNINEIINAVIYRINKPQCTLREIMTIVQGPDFPTGGIVQGIDGIKNAYKTGKGKIILKSRTEIVELENINQIIITEIPYDVNKSILVKKMTDVVAEKNVDGVLDIRDESDRQGLRIAIDLRKDANPDYIRNFLFKASDLQINYTFNMVCISDKKPMCLGLIEMLDAYIDHQRDVTTNRCNFELNAAKKRHHIVEGLISMVSILDAVIKTIRSSANKKEAKDNLVTNYKFSEEQAEAIVMLQLYRLTNTDIFALQAEKKELEDKINELTEMLANESLLMDLVKKELLQTLKVLSQKRRTTIEHKIDDVKVEVKELRAKEDVVVIITKDGYIKRVSPKNYTNGDENKLKEEDFVIAKYEVTTLDTILLFTNLGNYVYLPVQNIPECRLRDMGRNVSVLATISADETVMFTTPVNDWEENRYVLFTTKNGLTKRTHIREFNAMRISKALKATKIREDDKLVSIDICKGEAKEVMVVTKQGFMLRYNASEISEFAPASFGVKALEMKNRPTDEVIGAFYVEPKDVLLILNQRGGLRRFKANDVTKGKKIHVGKQYVDMTKNGPFLVDFEIVHQQNLNPEIHVSGAGLYDLINYEEVAKSLTIKKINTCSNNLGRFEKIIIARDSSDLE